MVKKLPASAGDVDSVSGSARSPGVGNDNLLHYSCWKIPWTEEPGGLQSMGLQKSWTQLNDSVFMREGTRGQTHGGGLDVVAKGRKASKGKSHLTQV